MQTPQAIQNGTVSGIEPKASSGEASALLLSHPLGASLDLSGARISLSYTASAEPMLKPGFGLSFQSASEQMVFES